MAVHDGSAPRNPDLSLLDPIELDRLTATDRLHILYRFADVPAVREILDRVDPQPEAAPAPAPAPAAAETSKQMADVIGLLSGGIKSLL